MLSEMLCGVVIMELPITSEKILKSLKAKGSSESRIYLSINHRKAPIELSTGQRN